MKIFIIYCLNNNIKWKAKQNERTLSESNTDLAVDGISLSKTKNKHNAKTKETSLRQKVSCKLGL